MEFITRNKINEKEWDDLLEKIPGNNVYSLSWYMDSLAENWMIARDAKGKNIMLFPFKSKAGVKLIHQPFFSREIVCCLDEKHTPASVIARLPSSFRQVEFSLRDIRGIDTKKFKVEKWEHQILDLSRPYKTIAKGFQENARRIIKKATVSEMLLNESDNVKPVVEFFRKSKGDKLKAIKEKDYDNLIVLMKTAIKNNIGKCYQVVLPDGEVLASGFFFDWNGRITYLKGSASEKGKKSGAMYFLMDQLIHKYAESRVEFDFGGSRVPSVATFNKKFGAIDSPYYFIKHQNLPMYFKWMKAAGKLLGK